MTLVEPTTRSVEELVAYAAAFQTTEYASLTRAGAPITWPVTPYAGTDARTVDVATGLTYPLKAERARRDPRVAISFTHPLGSGHERPAHVVIQGEATVRDRDLVATSTRYLDLLFEQVPDVFERMPRPILKRMAWYWTRMWVEVTPRRAWWWEDGDLTRPPTVWTAPEGTTAPPSDPAPEGRSSGSWNRGEPVDWRTRSAGAIERLGLPVVTLLDADGWPLPLPVRAARPTATGFDVDLPTGVDVVDGAAFLSFHTHEEVFDGQENVGLAGTARVDGGTAHVTVDRSLNDWCVASGNVKGLLGFLRAGRRLSPRVAVEAARRGQVPPTLADLGR